MVLAQLGERLTGALNKFAKATFVKDEDLDRLVNEICAALMGADVNIMLVKQLQVNIKKRFMDLNSKEYQHVDKKREIQKAVVQELVTLISPKVQPYRPQKNAVNVIMFVGLQGAGKTTTCTKYAYFWQKRRYKTALVCADTFRAGAFDQLRQNATKARVPFYGSYSETDPVKIARDGVDKFRAEGYEVIIVDTSGRHKQEDSLFEEMQQVAAAVQPNDIVFVMDSSIGQAAADQAKAFRDKVAVGSIIITKLDGHAKGGGALSAVAATGAPITFIGTGEHFDEFDEFIPESFVSRLLGMGDIRGLMQKTMEAVDMQRQQQLVQKMLTEGIFTMRDLKEQMQNILRMGPITNLLGMLPGMNPDMLKNLGTPEQHQANFKKFMTIIDSMNNKELDAPNFLELDGLESRKLRIARGAGRAPSDVDQMFEAYKMFKQMAEQFKNLDVANMGDSPADMQRLLSSLGNIRLPGMPGAGAGGMPGMGMPGMPGLPGMPPGAGGMMPPNMSRGMQPGQLPRGMPTPPAAARAAMAQMQQQAAGGRGSPNRAAAGTPPGGMGMPPGMPGLPGMGGPGGLSIGDMMNSMLGNGGLGNLMSQMSGLMGGGAGGPGGAGGMPDMAGMQEMMARMMGGMQQQQQPQGNRR